MTDQRDGEPSVLSKLHDQFAKYIDGKMGETFEKHRQYAMAPAFFIEDLVQVPPEQVVEPLPPAPFGNCWLVYSTPNGILGTISNLVMITGRHAATLIKLDATSGFIGSSLLDLDNPARSESPGDPRGETVRETLPEVRHILNLISRAERVESVPEPLERLNRKRRMNAKRVLRPFITIREPVTQQSRGGTHASPIGHERRGHWRTYKASGKRTWIEKTSINGGSPVARNYRVENG